MNTLSETYKWFEVAFEGRSVTDKNLHTQVGVHLEEVGEFLKEIYTNDVETLLLLDQTRIHLNKLSERLKKHEGLINFPNRVATIDGICDQLVTGTGCAFMLGMDPVGALDEVNKSNWSKYIDNKPVFDSSMKIMKGPNYFKPKLKPFVYK